MNGNHRITTLALFIALAVALHWVESFIPRPAPFLRFGLANVVTLCALYTFGGAWALVVVVSRVVVGSLLSGGLFSPGFALALSGGVAAALVMWAMPRSLFSPVGTSVGGAVAHMSAQLAMASVLVAQASLMRLLPLFLLVSVATGMINGYLVRMITLVMDGKGRTSSSPLTQ
ncbi:MAG TPA: Gx transporter family protein [Deltaproteobacteria bacterium]|jgi:heptaprenyl diphosphate synthase|nr:Gx transporter family protein [Deltaproteobacteria bacterium]HOI08286.1 Gx transporter family protein [Deltaproteobacteria bacterium]